MDDAVRVICTVQVGHHRGDLPAPLSLDRAETLAMLVARPVEAVAALRRPRASPSEPLESLLRPPFIVPATRISARCCPSRARRGRRGRRCSRSSLSGRPRWGVCVHHRPRLPVAAIVNPGPRPAGARLLWPVSRITLNVLLLAGGIALATWVAAQVRLVVVPVLVALLLATLLVPPVDALRRRGVPSVPATLVAMLLGIGAVSGVIALIAPAFADQAGDLGSTARNGLEEVLGWLSQGPLGLERADLQDAIDDAVAGVRGNADRIGEGVLAGATLATEILAGFLLVVVLVFFFVHDGRSMWGWLVALAPERHRDVIDGAGHEVWRTTTAYVRGVAIIAVVDALLIGLALVIIGVPLVVPLMVLVFLGAFVPLIGAIIAGAVAALVALISDGVVSALLVVAAITVIQQLEGDLLYPNIVGRAIRLHAVAILLVLTAGTVIAGILGALLAVPVAAGAWTAIDYVRRSRDAAVTPPPATSDASATA